MLPFLWPSCYIKTRPPSCALGTSFYTVLEGRDLMTYVSDNYTSYSAPSPLTSRNVGAVEVKIHDKSFLWVTRCVLVVMVTWKFKC